MSWIDDLLGKHFMENGVLKPDRKNANFIAGPGTTVTVVDNPTLGSSDVTIGSLDHGGADPIDAHAGSSYPTPRANAISDGVTIIRTAATDGDAIRFFGAATETVPLAYMHGQIINMTGKNVTLYPLATQKIYVNGTSLGLGAAMSLAIGSTVFWAFDVALDAHVSA